MKRKYLIMAFLIVIEALTIFLMYKDNIIFGDKELNNVNIKKGINNNMLAMYIESGDSYVEYDGKTFPEEYTLNTKKSTCIDTNGEVINEILSQDEDGKIQITSNKTAYCYLYFDKEEVITSSELIAKKGSGGLSTELVGDMYRYQGEYTDSINNYICFGTDEKCDATSDYMYRIIGITKDGKMKLIKNTLISDDNKYTFQWHNTDGVNWNLSDLYKRLNGTVTNDTNYSNLFIDNSLYLYMSTGSKWYNLIDDFNWKYGIVNNGSATSEQMYTANGAYAIENGWTTFIKAKIGLMYLHDFYYSYNSTANCSSLSNGCNNSWMHISHNGKENDNKQEWTISNNNSNLSSVHVIPTAGAMGMGAAPTGTRGVRPVFYLKNNVEFTGKGTIERPYVVIAPSTAGEKLKDKLVGDQTNTGLSTILVGDMYRYIGTKNDVKNYICFGTNNKCGETDDTMYRIIGITTDGQIKVMKNTALSDPNPTQSNASQIQWHNTSPSTWGVNDLYERLNGVSKTKTQLFIGNNMYSYISKNSQWYNLIEDVPWKEGEYDGFKTNQAANLVYDLEKEWNVAVQSAKIGLIYIHDFYFSYSTEYLKNIYANCYSESAGCKNSWMFIGNNGKTTDYSAEWTMSRYNKDCVWDIYFSGYLGNHFMNNSWYSVRPVFYLKSGLDITGSGTIEDPFIINLDS